MTRRMKHIALTVSTCTVSVALLLASMTLVAEAATCGGTQGGLQNPLNFCSIPEFIAGTLKAIAMIALPIITLLLVYSGFLFISARGNASQLETAKKNFVYVIIGALLILGAWILATLIAGTVSELTKGTALLEESVRIGLYG